MSIRYECPKCGSILKIKEELAGTDGKCPKCKTKFVVPHESNVHEESGGDSFDDLIEEELAREGKGARPADKKHGPAGEHHPSKPEGKAKAKPKDDDDFDAAAFLMEGNDGASRPSAGLGTQEPPKAAPGGRKPIAPPPAAGAVKPPPASSAAAAAGSMMGASANARDLLTKTAEESRTRQATMPEEDKGPKYDFSMLIAQLREYTIPAIAAVVAIPLLFMLSMYMFGDSVPVPELHSVTGTISLDGKPLSDVKVMLTPVNSEGEATNGRKISLRTAIGTTDGDGYYEVVYLPGYKGAPLGKVKVTIEPIGTGPEALDILRKLPPEYLPNTQAPKIAEVREAGNTDNFTFSISGR